MTSDRYESGVMAAAPSGAGWARELAAGLFARPARWGWQPANYPMPAAPPGLDLNRPPAWNPPSPPDATNLTQARSAARRNWLRFTRGTVWHLLVAAVIAGVLSKFDPVVGVVGAVIVFFWIIASLPRFVRLGMEFRRAGRDRDRYLGPYRQAVAQERARYEDLVARWNAAAGQYRQTAAQVTSSRQFGPEWFPVRTARTPSRIDVIGGDVRRHGWASLLLTLGTSLLAGRRQIVLLDLTGQQVGTGLLGVAVERGLSARRLDLPADLARVGLIGHLSAGELSDCLGYALTERSTQGADVRYERALVRDLIRDAAACLEAPVTFGRLAAAMQVLRGTAPTAGELSPAEYSRVTEQADGVGKDDQALRQLRMLESQLRGLAEVAPAVADPQPLWSADALTVISTPGGQSDRKELIDRVLVQVTQLALPHLGRAGGCLVVAGADPLGAVTLEVLSDHARQAGVLLMLMIAQPQGEIEKSVGLGGAVCLMKMYNHRDATVAAEFVGRGYSFVVSQVTRQTGSSFAESTGDSFSAGTTLGSSEPSETGRPRDRGQAGSLTESRAQTWTGVRNISLTQNLSDSTATSRVYEFLVEPAQLLDMPPTAFILVDNTESSRRIVMADSNPGICLLDRVALEPAAATA